MPQQPCSPDQPALPDQPARRLWLGTQGALAWAMLAAGTAATTTAHANRQASPRTDSPHVGVDPIFVDTGLTGRWQVAMGRDLGWQARWTPLDTPSVLRQLENGDVDAGLFLSHPLADDLDRQGLIHSRQSIATTDVLLVGPTDDLAGIHTESDAGRALNQVLLAAQAGAVNWVQPPEQSALAALLGQLTQGKGVDPRALRATQRPPAKGPAYELVPRVQWHAQGGGKGSGKDTRKIWLQGDARMVLAAQVACSFRVRHPGAKLLVNWLGWPLAQSAFKAGAPGWRGLPGKPTAPKAR